jgi:tetratricopeptide (TPR) repeat protein
MARVQLFLSTVSAEFLSYRDRLRQSLTRPNVEVKVQEDFIVTGNETLEMLDEYIKGCDGVIHLVGDRTGSLAKAPSLTAIKHCYPDLATRLPLADFLQPDGPSLPYTQWEAWLALLHKKKLFIATPTPEAARDGGYLQDPAQQALQQAHLKRLRAVSRYPRVAFTGQEHLAAEVLRSFVLDLLVNAGQIPPPPKPNPQLPQSHTAHNLPDRNTDPSRFVGRNVQREQLLELISPAGSRVFLTGMGGVGKSELALQVARSALDQFSGGVVQLDGRQGFEAMAAELIGFVRRSFADLLPKEGSPEELLGLCWNRWPAAASPPEPVLLVLDDLPGSAEGQSSEDRLCQGLPPRFRRLITRREAASAGVVSINLEVLQRPDALRLLRLQAAAQGEERIDSQSEAADALCQAVGDLPLALVLLGARLHKQRDLAVAALLADLQAKGAEAKALKQAHPDLGARLGVVESLLISWEPLSEPAKQLAILLATMAAAVIPWDLVEACRRENQELVEGSAFGDAQAELVEAQLLQRVGDNRYQLHPLVRQFLVLQAQAMEPLQEQWRRMLAQAVAALCREKFDQNMPLALQAEVEPYVAHIEWVAEHYSDAFSDDDLAWPCIALGRLRESQANYPAAEHWYRHCLELCDQRHGRDHAATTPALNNLAQLLKATNRLAEAEPLMRRALAIDEASYGLDHPNVAIYLNNLAQLLGATNRLAEAEPLMRRALAIDEASYGLDHPDVAIILNNLAGLLGATNRLAEAEPLVRRALQIDEASHGLDHPRVATRLNNLAQLLRATNRLAEAEPIYRRALAIDEASYGLDHPSVAIILNNLAQLLQATNRLAEAEPMYRRALAIDEASFGRDHPYVASCLNNLAQLLQDINRLTEAEPLMCRALAIDEASYGLDHPRVAIRLNNLAQLLQATNRLAEAEPLMRRGLTIEESSKGRIHPDVAILLSNLARLLQVTNRLAEAELLMRRALGINDASLSLDHPNSQTFLGNYKQILTDQGLSEEAIQAKLASLHQQD